VSELNEVSGSQSVSAGDPESIELRVKFDSSDSMRSRKLYGNGRMQVKVQVLVSGYDVNGDRVVVPAPVIKTVELIHYNTGKPLRDGWSASTVQGRYTLEAPVVPDETPSSDNTSDDIQPQVRTFWVSSSGTGTTQIAARISLKETIIRSNGTGLLSYQDSSVTLEAQAPMTYSIEQFRWMSFRRGNEEPGNRIWNYYLGLYPQGQQVKLVDWSASGEGGDVVFTRGNKLNATTTNYLEGILVRPEKREATVFLPFDGNSIAYTFYPDAITTKNKSYHVRVNDRDGELTVVQALSEYSNLTPKNSADGIFRFSAFDQYGSEHKLAIRTNSEERSFTLERG
jgi:hypothetical protein